MAIFVYVEVWEEHEKYLQYEKSWRDFVNNRSVQNSEVKKWFQELTELQFKEIQQIQKRMQGYYGLNAMENK